MAAIRRGLGFLPLIWSLLLFLGTISSYIIAICRHDVEAVLPSVSKTAAFEPEGSIFNQFLDIITFVGLIIVFVRFLQVEMATTIVKESDNRLIYRLRVASLTFGIGSMTGVSIAGNFRFPRGKEYGKLGIVHFIGSLMLGLCGIAYCFLESAVTYQLTKLSKNSWGMFFTRLLITCVLTVSGIIHVILKLWTVNHLSLDGNPLSQAPWLQFKATTEFYPEHVTSNSGEWLAVFMFALFTLTFFKEFHKISINFSCFPKNSEHSTDGDYAVINNTNN